jgi:hypothetical protein
MLLKHKFQEKYFFCLRIKIAIERVKIHCQKNTPFILTMSHFSASKSVL